MKLSVIIISYNVKYFLERCLHTVQKAMTGIEPDIFVVDNDSSDGSADMVAEKFPCVRLIRNSSNLGFSRANNQALAYVKSEYVLFLNPDTLIEEDTLVRSIEFMDNHPAAGAMGVKMKNGEGDFLPESKRSAPTLESAFYKLTGLTRLFPGSEIFGKYYLSHLDADQAHKIEVLTGAFFFARKKTLDRTGWFDEDFFMYGEDIDLSVRILKNGYDIWYYPGTSIVHFKGESTRKSGMSHVFTFYNAMLIYARKHFKSPCSVLLMPVIFLAVWLRAGLSISCRLVRRIGLSG
jgi:O-antigen biosynthesis protein